MIILFSIGMAAACENTTEPVCEPQSTDDALQMVEEPTLSKNSKKPVELFVDMTSDCDSYVVQGDTVKWTITVKSKGGVAHDTKVYTRFDGAKYISHHTKVGTYDKNNRVWKVGDLSPNKVVSLTIKTKATLKVGDIIAESLATTSSNKEYKTTEFYYSNYAQDVVFVGDPKRSITTYDELVESIPNNNPKNNNSMTITGSDDIAKNSEDHYFSYENSKKTVFFKSDESESFHKTTKADSTYKSVETGEKMDISDNLTKSNSSKNYDGPFSLHKVAVYLSKDKFSLAIVVLVIAALIGVAYKKLD